MNDFDHAIADFNAAIGLDPKLAFAYFSRGLAKRAARRCTGADADVAKAKALNPNPRPFDQSHTAKSRLGPNPCSSPPSASRSSWRRRSRPPNSTLGRRGQRQAIAQAGPISVPGHHRARFRSGA